jgi:hypothetical protein
VAQAAPLPSFLHRRLIQLAENQDRRIANVVASLNTIRSHHSSTETDSIPLIVLQTVLDPALHDLRESCNLIFEAANCSTELAGEISDKARETLLFAQQPASPLDRKQKMLTYWNTRALTYGEISFEAVGVALSLAGLTAQHRVFFDIGSGSGRVVLAAAFLHGFASATGLEILPSLHAKAEEVQVQYHLQKVAAACPVNFVCEDFRAFDWSHADVVFATATCFDEDLMTALLAASLKLKKGSVFITSTRELESHAWRLLASFTMQSSWGTAELHTHVKVE